MNTSRRSASVHSLLALVVLGAAPLGFAQVASPAKRAAAVAAAQKLLAAKEAALPSVMADPFHPGAFGASTAPTQTDGGEPAGPDTGSGPRSRRDLLVTMANALRAPNLITLGGQQYLLFGQKRVKAGEFLTINFEGNDYSLEVTAIDRTSFTLRLNREEYTRPIK